MRRFVARDSGEFCVPFAADTRARQLGQCGCLREFDCYRTKVSMHHQTRSGASAHRAQVTPAKRGKGNKARTVDSPEDTTPAERRAAMSWAQRLKRVFNIDMATCSSCGGHVKIIACIEEPAVIEKILRHLERKDAAATVHSPPSRGPPQGRLFG